MYRVTFILGISGKEVFHESLDFTRLLNSGESLLLSPGAGQVKVALFNDTGRQEIVFSPNGQGVLARAELRLHARSFLGARNAASDLVMPILSRWSFQYDVAIDMVAHAIVEEATDSVNYSFGAIGQIIRMDREDGGQSKPEHRAVLSAYREGTNALNVFYQLLCFWRVTEGVKRLRDRRRATMRARGAPYRNPPDEAIPMLERAIPLLDPEQGEFFRLYLDMKFTAILDTLRPVLRNAAAHLNPEEDLVADEAEDVMACERAIPVVRHIARVMLKNEFEADAGSGA